jgi:hypothetical protein
MAGLVIWYPYNDSNGNLAFGGEIGTEQGDYDVTCSGGSVASAAATTGGAKVDRGKWVTARTQAALTRKLERRARIAKIGYHVFVARHTHARSGRVLTAGMLATKSQNSPFRNVITHGKVVCRAKIGIRLGPNNPHRKLHSFFKARRQRWHHRNGVAVCVWQLPKHTKGKHVTYAVSVRYAGHEATLSDTHRVLSHFR